MQGFDIGCRNAPGAQVVPPELPPDQSKRAERLAVISQWRTALMVIEDPGIWIVGSADIIDDPVITGPDPLWSAAADHPSRGKKACQDDAGQQLIRMKAAGMRYEEIGCQGAYLFFLINLGAGLSTDEQQFKGQERPYP